ncbi:MAG: phosphoribosylformylglycinamidine synthase [Lysobacterales bacterium]
MILLAGATALSAFRRRHLDAALGAIAPGLKIESAQRCYVLADESATHDRARLIGIARLLGAGLDAPQGGSDGLWVLPRAGTRSPWSSKAAEILSGAGIQVGRIEQGSCYRLAGYAALTEAKRTRVARILHDPMTESLCATREQLAQMFVTQPPAPLRRIALGADPQSALAAANVELGLALSAEEIVYLAARFAELGRDPSDAELMMFAQANSEHCRHKVFNADWWIDGQPQQRSLFAMIRHTHAHTPQGTLSAYHDNAAVIGTRNIDRFYPDPETRRFCAHSETVAIAIKCETHNHPTAIAPHAGASTGSGGEIRDEGATGRGAKPKAGLVGFSVSDLRIPELARPWEAERGLPPRVASAFEIMRDAPLGAAAFNNEFGRPALCGYFRSFEYDDGARRWGYDKPIMLAGGLGNLRTEHVDKHKLAAGDALVVLGGPALLIGLGGGAASSLESGQSSEALDFASVQRDNPEMERRCQEVIDRCTALGAGNPLISIHDVGAGGLSNALPELLHDSEVGGVIELRDIPCDEPGMSPMQIWCNEAQERYVLGVAQTDLAQFQAICVRERCPFAVVGAATAERHLRLTDRWLGDHPIDLPMAVLFGNAPKQERRVTRPNGGDRTSTLALPDSLETALHRVLTHPSVGSKSFLITIGDRSVGGLCARDQMVGPWQTPVADCALTLCDFAGYSGEAMAIGERSPLAVLDAPAAARMAVAEALMNIAAAPIAARQDIKLSANWMAAVNQPGEDLRLFDAVHAVAMAFCPALELAIPVGKDSLSMQTRWRDAEGREQAVLSPVSLVVSAFAPVADVRGALTPELKLNRGDSAILLVGLPGGRQRIGGSILAQCFGQIDQIPPDVDDPTALAALFDAIQHLNRAGLLLAYHDRSDGGLLVALLEMAFAARCGLSIDLASAGDRMASLFNEEIGALVQVRVVDLPAVQALLVAAGLGSAVAIVAKPRKAIAGFTLRVDGRASGSWTLADLLGRWQQTSHAMQRLRDNPDCADQEQDSVLSGAHRLRPGLSFDRKLDVAAPLIARGARPLIAILREQGVNGQVEMAAAFTRAGFDAIDVHMSDLLAGRDSLDRFHGLAACGGFSYGDVLGAGRGWAASILHHGNLAEQFRRFFEDSGKFALAVCNGCQMFAGIKSLIPGARAWPSFQRNLSEQFEARLSLIEVLDSPSILFSGMVGSRIPVVVSHGEGRVVFERAADAQTARPVLRYISADGQPAEHYPANPNGSPAGLNGFCNEDGRVTLLMPHPERVFRSVQMSWHPEHWGEESPWLRLFRNARVWLG